jgi:hypothetical protein
MYQLNVRLLECNKIFRFKKKVYKCIRWCLDNALREVGMGPVDIISCVSFDRWDNRDGDEIDMVVSYSTNRDGL